MAKKSAIQKNEKRKRMVARDAAKRAALKATIRNLSLPAEERFAAPFVGFCRTVLDWMNMAVICLQ